MQQDLNNPLSAAIAGRPRAFKRTAVAGLMFWIWLLLGLFFLGNTIFIIADNMVSYFMIDVTSSQIAHTYNVEESHVRGVLVKSLQPFKLKLILYSLALAVSFIMNAVYCRKILRRGRYIGELEKLVKALFPPHTSSPQKEG